MSHRDLKLSPSLLGMGRFNGLLDQQALASPELPGLSLCTGSQNIVQPLPSPLMAAVHQVTYPNTRLPDRSCPSQTPITDRKKLTPIIQEAPNSHFNHSSRNSFQILSCSRTCHLLVVALPYRPGLSSTVLTNAMIKRKGPCSSKPYSKLRCLKFLAPNPTSTIFTDDRLWPCQTFCL